MRKLILASLALAFSMSAFAQQIDIARQSKGVIPATRVSSEEDLSFSATPTFSTAYSISTIVLSGNITNFTMAAGTPGQPKCLIFLHDTSSTAFTLAGPTNVRGLFTPGANASTYSAQCFRYVTNKAQWFATDLGVINQ